MRRQPLLPKRSEDFPGYILTKLADCYRTVGRALDGDFEDQLPGCA
jgi:hypothetical protein